jgi:hypothetical protein
VRLALIFTLICASSTLSHAGEPVDFADKLLKQAVESELWVQDPTSEDMLALTSLMCVNKNISDITGLEHAIHLQALWIRFASVSDISPLAELTTLRSLNLSQNEISDISPLSGLIYLENLNLHANAISDLSPLTDLIDLEYLVLHNNDISDISALSGLENLEHLDLQENYHVTDLSPLGNMRKLELLALHHGGVTDISILADLDSLIEIDLSGNQVSDIYALSQLSHLSSVDLGDNPLGASAYCSDLAELMVNNAAVSLRYDPSTRPPTGIEASNGIFAERIDITWNPVCNGPSFTNYYRVLRSSPGETDWIPISIWQTPVSYSDTSADRDTIYTYAVQSSIFNDGSEATHISATDEGWRASQLIHTPRLFHVDANSPHDPVANSSDNSDPLEDGTSLHPFDSIQEGVTAASAGDTVYVHSGTYDETIHIDAKGITLTGFDPNDPNTMGSYPVISANGTGPVLRITQALDNACVVSGFVLTQGLDDLAGAIYCDQSTAIISNCVLAGNRINNWYGVSGAVFCIDSIARFENCTITDNASSGIAAIDSNIIVVNSILRNNVPMPIYATGTSTADITYSNITLVSGPTNINTYALFVQPGYWQNTDWIAGDYHLLSTDGRWSPQIQAWINDTATSPCINAGDPASDIGTEQQPHGSLINLGAYGGTAQASKEGSTIVF